MFDDASQLLQYQSKVLLGGIGLLPVYINMILKEGEELTVSILWSPPPKLVPQEKNKIKN